MTLLPFEYYIERYLEGSITPEEWKSLQDLINNPDNDIILDRIMDSQLASRFASAENYPLVIERLKKELIENRLIKEPVLEKEKQEPFQQEKQEAPQPSYSVRFLKKAHLRYAAAILLLLIGVSIAYFWMSVGNAEKLTTTDTYHHLETDIGPGGEKALLTLADGSTIILDNAENGNLAQQGSAQVVKLADGQIVYNMEDLAGEVLWNTMSTPVGGQYQVILPDQTKVWLNAASSITYPTAFVDKTRKVKITGEAYFEVAKNKQKPFLVDIDGKLTVQALGTSFNINSYKEELSVKTTLIEGSVRIYNETLTSLPISEQQLNSSVILMPGQQAQVSSKDIKVTSGADIDQALAWKNGVFDFNDADIRAVMRQLERWYDISVKYEGNISGHIFKGKMYRNVNLSDVLEMFKKMGINFKIDGKTLTITE